MIKNYDFNTIAPNQDLDTSTENLQLEKQDQKTKANNVRFYWHENSKQKSQNNMILYITL